MSGILLSINPEHVERIMDGTKRFEFRKVKCRGDVSKIVIYCTSPVMKIVGEASVDGVLDDSPDEIWRLTSSSAGIDKIFFDRYYHGRSRAIAFRLGATRKFEEPRELSDYGLSCPPQSFTYLNGRD